MGYEKLEKERDILDKIMRKKQCEISSLSWSANNEHNNNNKLRATCDLLHGKVLRVVLELLNSLDKKTRENVK